MLALLGLRPDKFFQKKKKEKKESHFKRWQTEGCQGF
jgi:hypothetical protein